ncbi:MAG: hypothetical protein FWE48_03865 [Coriobacteriia bacterium]|nr:hypothetical protein [Coriobacteriia bacterium]
MKFARILPLIILSALLIFSLSACGGQEGVVESVASEEVENQQATEIDSGYFDVNVVNVIPIESVSVQPEDFLDTLHKNAPILEEIGQRFNVEAGFDFFIEGNNYGIAMFIINNLDVSEDIGNDGLLNLFQATSSMAEAAFTVSAEEEMFKVVNELLIRPEAQDAFDKAVVQVITDARSSHNNHNIYRLLDQVLELEEPNNFANLCAAFYMGFLRARGNDQDIEIASVANSQIELNYKRSSTAVR